MKRKRENKHIFTQRRIIIVTGVLVILILLSLISLNLMHDTDHISSSNDHQHSDKRIARKAQDKSSNIGDVLTPLTSKETEDFDTRTNNDITYSQFYFTNNSWYWKLTSDKRGTIEIAKLTGIKKSNKHYFISSISEKYAPRTRYTLNFHWISKKNKQYNVHTRFKSINGNYSLKPSSQSQSIVTTNLTNDQVKDWIFRNITKYTNPAPGNPKIAGDIRQFGFQFSRTREHTLTIFVVEDHDFDNAHGADVDPHVAPTVGSFEITKEGYLKANNIGTAGSEIVRKVTGSSSAQSAIIAKSFNE